MHARVVGFVERGCRVLAGSFVSRARDEGVDRMDAPNMCSNLCHLTMRISVNKIGRTVEGVTIS